MPKTARNTKENVNATRKVKRAKVLHVDSVSKVAAFENLITNGTNLTFVYFKRASCPACQRFDPIWGKACKKKRKHNAVVVDEDMLGSTSLSNANVNSLPSIIAVSPKGEVVEFNGPEGPKDAMKTPRTPEELRSVLNVNVPSPAPNDIANSINEIVSPENIAMNEDPRAPNSPKLVVEPISQDKPTPFGTPSGKVFRPTPQVAPTIRPMGPKSGGGLFSRNSLDTFRRLFGGKRHVKTRKAEHRRLGRGLKPGKKTRVNRFVKN